ncbi:MAG TPA: DUF1365 domain-containing protein [Thermoleophilaceae bacterium]|nr:DUF1365 domain-containing protein [Thermoleophilaceae bacterium]
MSASALYQGWVRHRRHEPVGHEFRYRIFLSYLDLDELPRVLDRVALWSARRPAPAWFRRADFMGPAHAPLRGAVLDAVEERTGTRPEGPVRLLTSVRTFGHLFNPISLYYCFDRDGERVEALAAEVTNTPWGERHVYACEGLDGRFAKRFHVSPFLGMEADYRLRASAPGQRLQVHVESRSEGRAAFDATLSLERRELGAAPLFRYPLQSVRVVTGIYAQAARLKLKGAPYRAHPAR